jgi:hypothetical protein
MDSQGNQMVRARRSGIENTAKTDFADVQQLGG